MRKLILCAPLLLAGCVTAQERMVQLAAADDAKCQSYGAQPGSPPYIQCRTQLDATRTQAAATIAAAPSGPTTCTRTFNTTTCY
jgi:hypothetical protein